MDKKGNKIICDCLPGGFVTKAQACENHLLPSVKLRRLKPLARRIVFPASTNIRIWSNPNDQMCFPVGASNISHQVDIDKKWMALPTRANVLTLNSQCVDRRSNFQRNTKPGGFTRLLSGGSLLDHILCPWPFLAKWACRTSRRNPAYRHWSSQVLWNSEDCSQLSRSRSVTL